MYNKAELLNKIMKDWSYRVPNGIPNANDYNHRNILKDVLREHGITNEEIGVIIYNLTSEKELLIELDTLGFISSAAKLNRDKSHHTGSEHQTYIDPYQVQNMLPVQDDEEDEEELEDDNQKTTVETYMFDKEQMMIVETGDLVTFDEITESKFKCFMTGEVYLETKDGTLVKENDIIIESGILDSTKIGQSLKDKSKTYILVSNEYYKDISKNIKNLKNIDVYGKENKGGYLIKLEDENGKEKYIVKYTDKKLTSKVPPKLFGLQWEKSSESLNIKPQNIIKSLLGKEVTAQEIISAAKNSIDKLNEPIGLKNYLNDLLDFSYRNKKLGSLLDYGELQKGTLAQVEKNYGEILGALWVASKNTGKILFPKRGNYPLIDFLFMSADETTKYSSKGGSGVSTNTISTKDIIKIIDSKKEYDVYKSGKYKDVYDIFNNVKDSAILDAPKTLADFFKIKYDEKELDDPEKWMDLNRKVVKEMNADKYIKLINEIVNGILTVDYLIIVLMKNPLKPDFIIKPGKEISVYFRDKNTPRHRRDKIGLQIK